MALCKLPLAAWEERPSGVSQLLVLIYGSATAGSVTLGKFLYAPNQSLRPEPSVAIETCLTKMVLEGK